MNQKPGGWYPLPLKSSDSPSRSDPRFRGGYVAERFLIPKEYLETFE
jgi:hypothetical protein